MLQLISLGSGSNKKTKHFTFSFTVFLLFTNKNIVPRLYKKLSIFTYTPTYAYMYEESLFQKHVNLNI